MTTPLSDEQIIELHKQWKISGDIKYRNALVEGMMDKVARWVLGGMRTNQDDIIAAGILGLIKGLDNSLKADNIKLLPYLCMYARGERNRFIESVEGLGCRGQRNGRKDYNIVPLRQQDKVLTDYEYWDDEEFKNKYNLNNQQFTIIKLMSEGYIQNDIFRILTDLGYTSFGTLTFTRSNLTHYIERIRKAVRCGRI